jgi:glucose/arabinose dehydrogenase
VENNDRIVMPFGAQYTVMKGVYGPHRATTVENHAPQVQGLATARTRTTSVYAKYVGRVGALAVALGVTGAMATGQGVAWADDAAPSAGSSTPTASTDKTSSATDPSSPPNSKVDPPKPPATTSESLVKSAPEPSPHDTDADSELEDNDLADENPELAEAQLEDTELEDEVPEELPVDSSPVPEPPVLPPVEEVPPTNSEALPSEAERELPTPTDSIPSIVEHVVPQGPDPTTPVGESEDPELDTAEFTTALTNPSLSGRAPTPSAATRAASALAASAITPAHAIASANPIATLISQIPTPGEVVAGIKRFVTQCACTLISGALDLFTNLAGANGNSDAPGSPVGNAAAWAVLGWVRRQFEYAVTAFNRTPIGQAVNQVAVAAREWFGELSNSPFGRQISAGVAAFLAQCEGQVGLLDDFDRTTLVSGLNEPTDFELIAHDGDPDHIHQILFTEKSGRIKLYDTHTGQLTTLATIPVSARVGERGLIGIEVDPNYWTEGQPGYQKIYVAYTNADNFDQLSSFTFDGSAISGEQMLVTSTLEANDFHHGGEVEFDSTGQFIYWAVGNNTRPTENSQDLTNIHGKILRLNRDGTGVVGNPFYNATGDVNTNRIYALGMRNPFRFAVDPQTGAVLAGDVGEYTWEELNLVKAGANYGWPLAEGPKKPGQNFVDPLYAYKHTLSTNTGSITSVMVYDDGAPVQGEKKVLIADYSLGFIKELTFDDQYTSLIHERTLDSGAGAVVKLAQAANGDIYQLNIYPGTLSIISKSDGNHSPVAVIKASPTSGAGDSLTVEFDGTLSTDPDGEALSYSWNFRNGETSIADKPVVTFTKTGPFTSYDVTLTVTDTRGKQNTVTQTIVVGSTAPDTDFTVTSPGGWKYDAGDTVSFHATGTDVEDLPGGGQLPADAFSWTVEFRHAEHKHPFINEVVGPDLTFTVPVDYDQLANTWYRVILTTTDESGLKTVVTKDIMPNLAILSFGSNVTGAQYTLDGIPHTGPYEEQVVVGVERTLGAVSPQTIGGQRYVFGDWADGVTSSTRVITTPSAGGTYTINYVAAPAALLV